MTYKMTFDHKYKPNSGSFVHLDRSALLRTVIALFDTYRHIEHIEISPETANTHRISYDRFSNSWWITNHLGRSVLFTSSGYKTLRGALNRLDKIVASEVTGA